MRSGWLLPLSVLLAGLSCTAEEAIKHTHHTITAAEQSASDGSDGALTVTTANTIINDGTHLLASEYAGDAIINVNDGSAFAIDDQILIVQMQTFADGATGTSEIATIQDINGGQLTLTQPITNSYFSGAFNTVNATSTQVVRIPEYTTVTIDSGASITASPWNGYSGGIVAFKAVDTIIDGSIDVSGIGYRGGSDGDIIANSGTQGESYTGLGQVIKENNGGGGAFGSQTAPAAGGNGAHGGGGGGHMTSGEDGYLSTDSPTSRPLGGISYSDASGSLLTLGSGGGSGSDDSYEQFDPDGGAGGGAVVIVTATLTNNGSIRAAGADGRDGPCGFLSGGGAGAGGYVHLIYRTDAMGAGTVDVAGGQGGQPSCCGRGAGGDGGTGYSVVTAVPLGYDFRSDAVTLTDLDNWSSADAAYTTVGATPDEVAASCWDNGPNYNRWFKFQATSTYINFSVRTGGTEGTVQYPFMALWDDAGTEITCERFVTVDEDLNVQRNDLTPGKWYYIAVDNYQGDVFRGSFSLSISDQAPILDYDDRGGALELTDLDNWSSANGEYTTVGATPDDQKGSCAQNGPNYNRWFKFQATGNYIDIALRTGAEEGTLTYPFMTLWDDAGAEIACIRYTNSASDISIQKSDLVAGEWYYLSVDNYDQDIFRGTFSLSVTDQPPLDNDFQAGATVLTTLTAWSSSDAAYTTEGATPDGNAGSCWSDGPNYNRWFAFQAVTSHIDITLRTGGTEGTVRFPYIALFDDADTELECMRYTTADSDLNIQRSDLTPGAWYYIAVDNFASDGLQGTFALSVNDQLALDYDFRAGAIVLDDLNAWSSADAAYTTIGATADGQSPVPCGLAQPNYNRWFRFVATTNTIDVSLRIGGSEGDMRYAYLALWGAPGNLLDCAKYSSSDADMTVQSTALTPGQTYYISVDNHHIGNGFYRGTFALSVNDE